jgi:hypothetical protein
VKITERNYRLIILQIECQTTEIRGGDILQIERFNPLKLSGNYMSPSYFNNQ